MLKPIIVLISLALVTASAGGALFTKYPKRFPVGPNPSWIVARDLNDDGWPEIITADTGRMSDPGKESPANDQISLLVAKGGLAYAPRQPLTAGFAPYAIAVANIDALRAPDLVVVNFLGVNQRDLTLLRNLSVDQNLFEPHNFTVDDSPLRYNKILDLEDHPVFTTPGLTSLAVGDFDSDGLRDVMASGWSSDALVFFPGHAQQFFGDPLVIPAPGGPRALVSYDFDGDGDDDLACAMYSSGEIALWENKGARRFEEVARFLSRGRLPQSLVTGDVNGDGKSDLIVSHCHADDSVVIFYGAGGFSFEISQEILLGSDRRILEHEIRGLTVDDFNGDKRLDIAAACFGSGAVIVLENTAVEKGYRIAFRTETYTFSDGKPRALCAGDYNRDGAPDLAIALWEADSVALLLGNPPRK